MNFKKALQSSLLFVLIYCWGIETFGAPISANVVLEWKGSTKVLTQKSEELTRLNFLGASFGVNTNYNPSKLIFIDRLQPNTFIISNEVFEPLTGAEINLIDEKSLNQNLTINFEEIQDNGNLSTRIEIVGLRKESITGNPEKLVSFTYAYDQLSSGRNFRSQSNGNFGLTNSVLATGNWYKISVSKDGVYKIDYELLKSFGIDPSSISPKNIKIYGNGGAMLPQPNKISRIDDLQEVAIKVIGEEDNVFNTSDYILFYGESPNKWSFDSTSKSFNHIKNVYSDFTYYFLTIANVEGKRIADFSTNGNNPTIINTFDDRVFYENDLNNILSSGREWVGEIFDYQNSQDFNFSLNSFVSESNISLRARILCSASSYQNSKNYFKFSLNGISLGSISGFGGIAAKYTNVGVLGNNIFKINSSILPYTNSLNVNVLYNNSSSPLVSGYLDWIEIFCVRPLTFQNQQQGFRAISSSSENAVEYQISNSFSELIIWDVSIPSAPSNQILVNNSFISIPNGNVKEFFMFNSNDYLIPTFIKQVANQNLHGITAPNLPDLLIVTDVSTLEAANKLGVFRETNDGFTVSVVTTEQIYNEFSSGAQDVSAIRDFMRMLYKRKIDGQDSLSYLCLFGSCSYDYKNRVANNTNLVPVYQTYNSLHEIWSFSSDDYYGLLDDSEGEWSEIYIVNEGSDIGIGRLPVRNSEEAATLVDKIIHYHTNRSTLGNWKNVVSFVADPGDANLHQNDANTLASKLTTRIPDLNVNKFFVDSYQFQTNPTGFSAPACSDAITKRIQQGTLLFNYTGHGNSIQLSGYNVFNKIMINNFTNYDNLTFGVFATCDFGRYDDPKIYSGGQNFILAPKGGSIGSFNSTRPVYSNTNYLLNDEFYNIVFNKSNGKYPRLGDVYKYTKNKSLSGLNNRNYAILGDPSMRLEYPDQNIVVTNFNGLPKSEINSDTLRALSKITIGGEVRDENNVINTNFNGQLNVVIYDKENTVYTLGQKAGAGNGPMPYNIRSNVIYNGLVSVSAGGFNVTLVIPKDISYNYGTGKISLYAFNDNTMLDAGGSNYKFTIGGSNPNAVPDTKPPLIKLFMNDESFVHGGFTNSNPLLVAKLYDENGINVSTSSIGHEITGILASDKSSTLIMNEYYKTELNTYTAGGVNYNFRNLSPGPNAVTFKAWDTHNNSSESYLEFVVASSNEVAIKNLLNWPNPFTTHTRFEFDHNKPGEDLEILVQIFTISGKLVRTLTGLSFASPSHVTSVSWNGHDDFESEIGKGV